MSESRDDTEAYEPKDDLDAGLAAAFGPAASIFASLCESSPGMRPVELRHAPEEGSGLVERPNSREMPSPSTTGRYQVFGEIARGGMGAILRGRDPDLGRDIAIKVLREDHRANPKMIERFVEEAQIGGQLQHPGIAPVYELNQFSDRRPYFTMKLVKGRTLAALFANRAELADNRAHLVSIFTHVAQTMAYAHSRGVIHRDLKPANIMVGSFGEVQVMDWGLAKVLSTGGLADEQRSQKDNKSRAAFVNAVSEIKTFRSTGSGFETMAGSLLGTPAYMAPEQARGDNDLVDERSDVFGLGAILCELLTGKPPYTGESPAEVQRKASLGELTDAMARLKTADADEELVELARRCIAAEPWDRPRDAKSVADAAAAYQAAAEDRLRRAEKDCAVAEMQAVEERKRRRVGMALVASVLTTLGLIGASIWWWHDREEKADRDARIARAAAIHTVERGLDEAAQYRDSGRWHQAQQAASKAEELLKDNVPPELRKRVTGMQADLKLLLALDENRIQFAGERNEVFDFVGADAGYERAFQNYGVEIKNIDAANAQDRFPPAIRVHVAEALDHWGQTRKKYFNDEEGWKKLIELAQVVDVPDPWRQKLRAARLHIGSKNTAESDRRSELATQKALAQSPERTDQPVSILVALARNLREGSKELSMAYDILAEARIRSPGDFWVNYELGETCMALNRCPEAVRYFNAALATRPQNTYVMTSVAWALAYSDRLPESEVVCRRVIQLQPDFDWGHGVLGYVLMEAGKDADALVETRSAMRLRPKAPHWINNLGVSHKKLKQFSEAEARFREALTLAPDFPFALRNLVDLLKEQNRNNDLTVLYRESTARQPEALDRRLRLAEHTGDAKDIDDVVACYRRNLAKTPFNSDAVKPVSSLLQKHKREQERVAVWKEAVARTPESAGLRVDLAYTTSNPADMDAAIVALRSDIKKNVGIVPWHRNNLAVFLRRRSRYAEAEEAIREAIRVKLDDAHSYRELNLVLMDTGRRAEAVAMLRDAIKRWPKDDELWYDLGFHLAELGHSHEAIEPLQRCLQIGPSRRLAWNILAFAYFREGRFQEASDAFKEASAAAKRQDPNWKEAGELYVQRMNDMSRLAELANDLPAIIDGVILPKDAAEAVKFAQLCQYRGFHAQALRFYQQAFAANASLARTFYIHQAACDAISLSTKTNSTFKAAAARQQALQWLRRDLDRIDKQLASGSKADARNWLNRWQQDEGYNAVRDPALLAKLPPEEKAAWEHYWKDLKVRSDKLGQPEPAASDQQP